MTKFVKSLTGSDTINARQSYVRPFQFVPSAKFILACNHQPIIRDDTHGMWRRVRLVPFTQTFAVNFNTGMRWRRTCSRSAGTMWAIKAGPPGASTTPNGP